jgi:hypothetical protein
MKRIFLVMALVLAAVTADAFDWKPQTNEELRNEMFAFVEKFRDGTEDRKLSSALNDFLEEQRIIASSMPYAWIQDTHDFVDLMMKRYTAEMSDGGNCSYERCNLLLLRDYPMHVDDKPKDAPQELKDAYSSSVMNLYAAAENAALDWLAKGGRSKKLDVFKLYNMGFIFRSQGQTVGIDLQWSGDRAQMKELASHLDVLFLTHPHGDHFTKELLEVMVQEGKPVVLPRDLLPEMDSSLKIIVNQDNQSGMTAGGVSFKSMMGNQGPRTPCNVYLISVGDWNIAHNGDNEVAEAEAYLSSERVDVLVSACWNGLRDVMNRVKANPDGTDCIYFSAHENEWRHTVDHREAYEELFRREDRLGDHSYDYLPSVVLDAAGDSFILK